MPFRLFAFLLLILVVCAGCTPPRDAADLEPGTDVSADTTDTTATDETGDPMPPNIAVYLDGTWTLTLTPRDGGEPITGTWTIHEGGENRLATSTGLNAPVRVAERTVTGDVFFVTGVIEQSGGPVPFEAGGTLRGNDMTGEATIEGLGTFDLTGTRRTD